MSNQRPRGAEAPQEVSKAQLVKLAIDLGPLVLFFAVFVGAGLIWATGAVMIATVIAMVLSRVLLGHVSAVLVVTTFVVLVFGGVTIWLDDPRFIKMKPTLVNLLFGGALGGGLLFGRSLLQHLLGEAMSLTAEGWRILTVRWMAFFFALAALNEVVWRNFSDATWVTFKSFGILAITAAFAMAQMRLIERHRPPAAFDPDAN